MTATGGNFCCRRIFDDFSGKNENTTSTMNMYLVVYYICNKILGGVLESGI